MLRVPRRYAFYRQLLRASYLAAFALLFYGLKHSMSVAQVRGYEPSSRWIANATAAGGSHRAAAPPAIKQLRQLTPSGVPKIIHFIYRDANILNAYKAAMETCSKFNQDWQIVLWTDAAIAAFLRSHFAHREKLFFSFPHKIQRADAIRYLILHKFGGVYMDLDMVCHRPLLPALSPCSCFIDRERQHQTQVLHGKQYSAMNSAMGCTAGHPFFQKVIEFVFHPDRLKKPFVFPKTIFDTTGPAMLTRLHQQWQSDGSQPPVALLNETYFSPKINPRSGIYGRCRAATAGKFPAHGRMSQMQRACLELKQLGFEKSDELFITNRTVAIHQFTHLGYGDQKSGGTFNVTKEFPQVKSYYQLVNSH